MSYLKRSIEPKLANLARGCRVLKLMGQRQVGKYTLLRAMFPEHRMIRFNPVADLYGARQDPERFLDTYPPPLLLRGVQYVPELMTALMKRARDLDIYPAYILSCIYDMPELMPAEDDPDDLVGELQLSGLTLEEMWGMGNKHHWLESFLEKPESISRVLGKPKREHPSMIHYLWRGGLPTLCGHDDRMVGDFLYDYLQMFAERDARQLQRVSDLALFGRFIAMLSEWVGRPLQLENLAAVLEMDLGRAERWLEMLIQTYQWRELPHFGPAEDARLRIGFFTDTGLTCALQAVSSPMALAISPWLQFLFKSWAINELIAHASCLGTVPKAYHWRKNNLEVPLVFELDGKLFPFDFQCRHHLDASDAKNLMGFLDEHGEKESQGVIIFAGKKIERISDRVTAIPWDAGIQR